jgi:negative regulator of flagellin synthesis FlgM
MRVNDSTPIQKPATPNVAANAAGASKSAEKTGAAAATADNVRLSEQAKELATSSGRGVFDAKKVAEIKAAIADGTFKVDARKVADGLIDSVKELTPKRK